MHDAAGRVLIANLALLPTATRAALSAEGGADVRAEAPDFTLKVRTPSGAWVPMFASADPVAAAVASVARLSADGPPPLVIVIGLGAGFLLDALEAAGHSATRVLAIEPVPALTRMLFMRRDCSGWLSSGRLTVLAGPDYAGTAEAWRAFPPGVVKPPTIITPVVDQHFPEEAGKAKAILAKILGGVQANDEARRQFAGRYLLNTLANLPRIVREGDARTMAGAFPSVPAIVVGAGPSLDRNLPALELLQHRALVIAVDTALRPLVAAGIRPHLVVAVDPSDMNARHLQHLPNVSDVWFVGEGSLDPSVFPPFEGRTFTFRVSDHHPWAWLEARGAGRGTLRAWGSVLTTCFDLACVMGCDPIAFAGADLAYSRGLQYCRNTTYEPDWRDFPDDERRAEVFRTYLATRPHLTVPDVHGAPVITAPQYLQFRDWIVARAGEVPRQRVWNATGGGILHGNRIEQVDDLVDRLSDAPVLAQPHRRLQELWQARPEPGPVMDALDRAFADPGGVPVADWQAFVGERVPAAALERAIADARRAVHAHAQAAAVVDGDRDQLERRLGSRETAEAAMHPRYAFACAQAPAQLAHVLLDIMQRTYAVDRAAPMLDVVEAATGVPTGLRVLDVGCGLGRAMVPLVEAGHHVDGVDVSARVIELAREDPRLASSSFFVSNGMDCGEAPAGEYDLVYALNAFHQVRPRAARQALLQAMARALRPGGVIVVQLPFFPDRQASSVGTPHVPWSADLVPSASPTANGPIGEVQCTPDELPIVYEDFSAVFRDVTLRIVDFPTATPRFGLAARHRLAHLVVSASNDFSMAARMYDGG